MLVVLWLLASIGMLARQRFFNPEDIDGGGLTAGSAQSKVLQSVLQNTLEQAVLAVFVHVAWAAIMPLERMAVLPMAAILFTIGRLFFWCGYHRGAAGRALGFGLTFYPTVLLFGLLIVQVVAGV